MRKTLVCANWKMNHNFMEATGFFRSFDFKSIGANQVDVAIFPQFPFILPLIKHIAPGLGIEIGAQTVNENASGAYTGEVSASALKSIGVSWVLIGHSERREMFSETDEKILKKIHIALSEELKVILCVGEKLDIRQQGKAIDHVKKQLELDLKDVSHEKASSITIAYEPVWAIGTGLASSPDDAQEMMSFIRMWIAQRYNPKIAGSMRILYGGSVNPKNMSDYAKMPDIDGALVGGASLNPESFLEIIKNSIS